MDMFRHYFHYRPVPVKTLSHGGATMTVPLLAYR